jgi:septation ring formation regulator EzrA
VLEELKSNLKQVSSNFKQLGEVFSELSSVYSEVEKPEYSEVRKFQPRLSTLYDSLKKSVFQISNSYEQQLSIFKRYFERNLNDIIVNSEKLNKVWFAKARPSKSARPACRSTPTPSERPTAPATRGPGI